MIKCLSKIIIFWMYINFEMLETGVQIEVQKIHKFFLIRYLAA